MRHGTADHVQLWGDSHPCTACEPCPHRPECRALLGARPSPAPPDPLPAAGGGGTLRRSPHNAAARRCMEALLCRAAADWLARSGAVDSGAPLPRRRAHCLRTQTASCAPARICGSLLAADDGISAQIVLENFSFSFGKIKRNFRIKKEGDKPSFLALNHPIFLLSSSAIFRR